MIKRQMKAENLNIEEFNIAVIKHTKEIKDNIRKNEYISTFQFEHDYFIEIIAKKVNENKIVVKIYGIIKDFGRKDDIEIRI